jgi:hypothetical protein
MNYRKRLIESRVLYAAKHFPVILITGARQVGKTTLLRHLFEGHYPFYTFDPVSDIHHVRENPDLFLNQIQGPAIFDEVQYVPELLNSIKRTVDTAQKPGHFFLTGSQNFSLLKSISESLAGRVFILHLHPITFGERAGAPASSWLEAILDSNTNNYSETLSGFKSLSEGRFLFDTLWRGGMPGAIDIPADLLQDYFRSYVQTYIERDVRQLADIRELQNFNRFFALCAALTAQEINHSQIGRDIGVTPQTAYRWMELLAGTFQWTQIPAFSRNPVKKLSGKAKGYISDTGLACMLQFLSTPRAIEVNPLRGRLFETAMINDIIGQISALSAKPTMYHWRTHGGAEIDFLCERDGKVWLFEIKSSESISTSHTRGFRTFKETYPDIAVSGEFILAPVVGIQKISETAWILPYDLANSPGNRQSIPESDIER